jgi:hypothetical protein
MCSPVSNPVFVSAICLLCLASIARAGEVSGPYANRLSQADIAQIKTAVRAERSVPHNVRKIDAVRPDRVAIQTGGRTGMDSATYYDFNVHKRAGKWTMDASSITTTIEATNNRRMDSDVIAH